MAISNTSKLPELYLIDDFKVIREVIERLASSKTLKKPDGMAVKWSSREVKE